SHHDRLVALLDSGEIVHGGRHDRNDRYVAPTIILDPAPDAPVLQEEIFGPLLPVLTVGSVQQVIDHVAGPPRPIGLYVFAEDRDVADRILDATESGTAAVNDCTTRPLVREVPSGGAGGTGMGEHPGGWGL